MYRQPEERTNWRERIAGNGMETEARIAALQSRRRLAIHVVEKEVDKNTMYATNTLKLLHHNAPRMTPPAQDGYCQKQDYKWFSMSLLPTPQSGQAIRPYTASENLGEELAYLFNLDETTACPARVVRVFKYNGSTQGQHESKALKLEKFIDSSPAMMAFYQPYAELPESLREKTLITDVFRNPALSGRQLDILSEIPRNLRLYTHNEVVAAATPAHIEAICIPVRLHEKHTQRVMEAMARFSGALAGIRHAKHRMDLPVMLYHADHDKTGQCVYVAQGEEECRQAAMDALRDLRDNGRRNLGYINPSLHQKAKRILNIDAHHPATWRKAALHNSQGVQL